MSENGQKESLKKTRESVRLSVGFNEQRICCLEFLYLIYCKGMCRTKVATVLSEKYGLNITHNLVKQMEDRGLKALCQTSPVNKLIEALNVIYEEEIAEKWKKMQKYQKLNEQKTTSEKGV